MERVGIIREDQHVLNSWEDQMDCHDYSHPLMLLLSLP